MKGNAHQLATAIARFMSAKLVRWLAIALARAFHAACIRPASRTRRTMARLTTSSNRLAFARSESYERSSAAPVTSAPECASRTV